MSESSTKPTNPADKLLKVHDPMTLPDGTVIKPGVKVPMKDGKDITVPKSTFPMQIASWIHLQLMIDELMNLPVFESDFEAKYGKFDDSAKIKGVLDVFKSVKDEADKFGNAFTLQAEINKAIEPETPPEMFFAHTVWLGNKTYKGADAAGKTLKTISGMINSKGVDPKMRLKALSFGFGNPQNPTNLTTLAKTQHQHVTDYNKRASVLLAALIEIATGVRLDDKGKQVGPIDKQSLAYLLTGGQDANGQKNGSKNPKGEEGFIHDASLALKSDKLELKADKDKADKLNDEYIGFCATAGVSAFFSFVPLVNFVAIPAAIGFGAGAAEVKKQLDAKNREIDDDNTEIRKKKKLISDLENLERLTKKLKKAVTDFVAEMTKLEHAWGNIVQELETISKELQALETKGGDIKDLGWMEDSFTLMTIANGWGEVKAASSRFVETGLAQKA